MDRAGYSSGFALKLIVLFEYICFKKTIPVLLNQVHPASEACVLIEN